MRLIARFALDENEIIDVFDEEIKRIKVENNQVDSIMNKYPSAIWMERKINDEFGIKFNGAFDNRPAIKHERFPKDIYPLKKDFKDKEIEFSDFKPYKYEEIQGDSVYVVPVGPIHAGIIEPGHFQFSQAGEQILHLEVKHFYKYRGIEKMCENKNPLDITKIIARISGNESIAYQKAYFDILSKASNQEISENIKRKQAILLEIERIIHHLTDLGFIPNDAGFSSALAYMSKLAEEVRRKFKSLTNHRFGFDAIFSDIKLDEIDDFWDYLRDEVEYFKDWIIDIPSLWDRFETTGQLTKQKAIKYGVVGVGARASGIKLDVRDNEWYKNYGYEMKLGKKGEVGDRFLVRIEEVLNSIEMIKNLWTTSDEKIEFSNFNDGEYMSFVESSIGELFMFVKIKDGVIDRFYARDASHINWQAFHTTIYKDIIADFPLINKSFDLSYAGNDL